MATNAFIVARLSSSRLPGKALLDIMGKPMTEIMVERIRMSKHVDNVIIATSVDASDDPLEKLAGKLGIGCYRGSLEDVMDRISGAARAFNCDTIVELLADNPLVHSDLIDDVIEMHRKTGYDYTATVTKEYPDVSKEKKLFSVGIRVQVYSRESSEKWHDYPEYVRNPQKHPCAYIFEHPQTFKIGYLEARGKWGFLNRPDLTFAVNYYKNYALVRGIFEKSYPQDKNFSLKMVMDQLDMNRYLYVLMGSE